MQLLVEVNAETDFVAKNEKFKTYVAEVAAQAVNTTGSRISKDSWLRSGH